MRKVLASPLATVRSAYPELRPIFETRYQEEGYESLGSYFFWLGVYDVLLRKPHHVTAYLAHLSPERQEDAVLAVAENFDNPHKPGGLFQSRLEAATIEENWKLHAENRELRDRVRELEQRLDEERRQGKLAV